MKKKISRKRLWNRGLRAKLPESEKRKKKGHRATRDIEAGEELCKEQYGVLRSTII
jgi:hypothetical protein